jgi:3-phosphoglycerate kinase
VKFVSDCIGQEAENAAAALNQAKCCIENLRFHSEEEAGDVVAKQLVIRRYLC